MVVVTYTNSPVTLYWVGLKSCFPSTCESHASLNGKRLRAECSKCLAHHRCSEYTMFYKSKSCCALAFWKVKLFPLHTTPPPPRCQNCAWALAKELSKSEDWTPPDSYSCLQDKPCNHEINTGNLDKVPTLILSPTSPHAVLNAAISRAFLVVSSVSRQKRLKGSIREVRSSLYSKSPHNQQD